MGRIRKCKKQQYFSLGRGGRRRKTHFQVAEPTVPEASSSNSIGDAEIEDRGTEEFLLDEGKTLRHKVICNIDDDPCVLP